MSKWKKPTGKRWARIRQASYAVAGAVLSYAGIKGWVENDESQALLVLVGALLGLASAYVDPESGSDSNGVNTDTTEELDSSRDVSS